MPRSSPSSPRPVVASYLFRLSTHTPSDWEIKGVAIAVVTLVSALVIVHQKLSLHVINVLGVVKILTLVLCVDL